MQRKHINLFSLQFRKGIKKLPWTGYHRMPAGDEEDLPWNQNTRANQRSSTDFHGPVNECSDCYWAAAQAPGHDEGPCSQVPTRGQCALICWYCRL